MDETISKREETLIKKYGSKEALAAKRREWQAKSRENYKGTGGFAKIKKDNPELFKEWSSKGGQKSKRGKNNTSTEKDS